MTIPRRFSPAPGISVDVAASAISIRGSAQTWGPHSTVARAAEIQATLNRIWTANFANGFRIDCALQVTHRGAAPAADVLQIEIDAIAGPSHVTTPIVYGPRTMTLNASERDAFSWTVAHEFGHVLGMKDRYSESITSTICGRFGCQRSTPADRGYERLLMGVTNGVMDTQTLDDLNAETAPSPYWINDDDQTRDWVMGASPAAIAALPGRQKLQAMRVLMGYWISDEDVAAMERICAHVGSAAHARMIRQGINLLDFGSIGQRTRMRLAFAGMPG